MISGRPKSKMVSERVLSSSALMQLGALLDRWSTSQIVLFFMFVSLALLVIDYIGMLLLRWKMVRNSKASLAHC